MRILIGATTLVCACGMAVPARSAETVGSKSPRDAAPPAAVSPLAHFVTGVIPLRNARVGRPYKASIGGLVRGGAGPVRFAKRSGPAWAKVSPSGLISGKPGKAGSSTLTVGARRATGGTATARVRIDVVSRTAPLVRTLKVMSFNMWYGGTKVRNYREKQLRFLLNSGADIAGLQENYNTAGKELARALGWYYHSGEYSWSIISRYPIVYRGPKTRVDAAVRALNARVQIDERTHRQVTVWDAHTGFDPYGPYEMCLYRKSRAELLKAEESSGRAPQIRRIVKAMRGDLRRKSTTPVVMTADFNAPSDLDYTPATAAKHCGYSSFPWPTSVVPRKAGLTDSFRKVHPDPLAVPGDSWSVTDKVHWWIKQFKGRPEPQDRIDFVYYAGGLKPVASQMLVAGKPRPRPDYQNNEWTSDHAAMMTTFRVLPARPSRLVGSTHR